MSAYRSLRRFLCPFLAGLFCLPAPLFALRPQPDLAGVEQAIEPGGGVAQIRLGPAEIERFRRLREEARQQGWRFDPLDPKAVKNRLADYPWSWMEFLEGEAVSVGTSSVSGSDRIFLDVAFRKPELLDRGAVSTYFNVKPYTNREIPWVDLEIVNLREAVEQITGKPAGTLRIQARFRAMDVDGYMHLQLTVRTLQEVVEQLPVVLAVAAFFLKPETAAGAEDKNREEWIRRHIEQRRGKNRRAKHGGSRSRWTAQPIPPDLGPFPWARAPAPPSAPQPALKKPEAPKKVFSNGLNLSRWPDRVRASLQDLHKRGMTLIPVPGGVAVLFLRKSPSLDPEVMLDLLLLSFDGVYYPIGRLDLKLDLRNFEAMVAGPASAQFSFKTEAQQYISTKGLTRNNVTGFNPFAGAREHPWDRSGMQVWTKVLDELQINEDEARNALLFAAVSYFRSYYSPVFWFSVNNRDHANVWPAKFLDGLPGLVKEEENMPSVPLSIVSQQLENRLMTGAFDPVLAGMEEVHRLAEIWVSEAAAASSVVGNSRLKRQAIEAIKAIANPKVLSELLEDRVHTDRIWPGQTWSVLSRDVPVFPLVQVNYLRSGPTLYFRGASRHIPLEADISLRGPLSLRNDLWVNAPETGPEREKLPVFLSRFKVPLGVLNMESVSAVVADSRGRPSVRRFPLVVEASLAPDQKSVGEIGARWMKDSGLWARWIKNGRIKVLSHVHGVHPMLSRTDILSMQHRKFTVPMLLMNSVDLEAKVFIPKGLGGLSEAVRDFPDGKASPPFDEMMPADKLEWLRRYFLVVPVDLPALARIRRLSADLFQPDDSRKAAVNRVLGVVKRLMYDRSLRPVSVGPSVAGRHPGFMALDGVLPAFIFSVDPGGDKTEGLVRELANPDFPVDQVLYHGSEEEHRHFALKAAGSGISAGDQPVDSGEDPSFTRVLQTILVSLSRLTLQELTQKGINIRQLAEDLELLEGT